MRFSWVFLLVVLSSLVYADDLVLSVNQSDYYFLVGDEAVIPLETENNLGRDAMGILSYTITQQINQGNFQCVSFPERIKRQPLHGKGVFSVA